VLGLATQVAPTSNRSCTRSLAAGVSPTTLKFSIGEPYTSENHTVSSIIWPEGAKNMPFVQQGSQQGELSVDLSTPGLYAFQCRVHPYMLGAAVIDDPATPGADLGMKVRWIDGTIMPTAADEILTIVRSFFILSEPANWQYYADHDTTWDPSYPAAPIMTGNADGSPNFIPNLDAFQEKFHEPVTLKAPVKPTHPGVGEVLVDTQFELSAGKTKPGSITAYDAETWELTKKLFLPQINMNNPHNMAVSQDQSILFQNEWFSNKTTAIDRETGKHLYSTEVGPSPSHVMRRPGAQTLIVPNNGGNRIVELDPEGKKVIKSYLTQAAGENPAFPHAHWVSFDGKHVVTPNSNEANASVFDLDVPSMVKPVSGGFPVAVSMTNDGKRAYVANLLDHTITCLSIDGAPACPTPEGATTDRYVIDLRQNYDKITGEVTGPYGLSPIQLPISPDDHYMLVVGTFTANILQIDMRTNKIVKSFPCGPGCHGINFGAKKGGGYYGYTSIKFANKFIVVDGDPNDDGDLSDATIAGEMLTTTTPTKVIDDTPVAQFGQGGQGVWAADFRDGHAGDGSPVRDGFLDQDAVPAHPAELAQARPEHLAVAVEHLRHAHDPGQATVGVDHRDPDDVVGHQRVDDVLQGGVTRDHRPVRVEQLGQRFVLRLLGAGGQGGCLYRPLECPFPVGDGRTRQPRVHEPAERFGARKVRG
jgi:DNA-binding beta-propeller fold protein YncE